MLNRAEIKVLMKGSRDLLPKSETHFGLNCLGALGGVLTLFTLSKNTSNINELIIAAVSCVVTICIILVGDVLVYSVHKSPSSGIGAKRQPSMKRVFIKIYGLYGTLAVLLVLYHCFPEYDKPMYSAFWIFVSVFLPILVGISLPYFYYMDGKLKDPEDAYYNTGLILLLKFSEADRKQVIENFRDWVVKAYFFPIMLAILVSYTHSLIKFDLNIQSWVFKDFYDFNTQLLWFVDVLFATTGYLFTLRCFNTHIRTSDPHPSGWVVALICYEPFWTFIFTTYLAYNSGKNWADLLPINSASYYICGMIVVMLWLLYVSSHTCLGYRFSNLTYRGLVTCGPYKFTKHPAYLAKNLAWWFMFLPFYSSSSLGEASKNCLLLLIVNMIYYLRARTEERHLSLHPEYVEYATYMNDHSILRFIGNLFPFTRYKAPVSKELSRVQPIDLE